MMEMPRLLDEHRRLKALAGDWVGEETILPSPWDPKGGKGAGRFVARLDLNGFFLVADYVQERSGQVTYRGHGVYGYDPQQTCYTMHWFDSMGSGTPGPVRGRWEADRLTFEGENPMGHSRYIYALEGADRYAFRIEHSRDGKTWAAFIDSRYARKQA
jgi:hypothetical protein